MSALSRSAGELNNELASALADISANRNSTGVHLVAQMYDALLDVYVSRIPDVKPEDLPALQIAIRQVKALRDSIISSEVRRPTIF